MDSYAGWACLLTGVAAAVLSVFNISRAMRSNGWRRAPAEIFVSAVVDSGSSAERRYAHAFRYRYEAHDGTHTGTRLRFTPAILTRASTTALTEKYPVGMKLDVFYDPAKPSVSVVEPGGGISMLLFPAVALCFLLGGIKLLGFGALLTGAS